jgi:hypothetical protein
MQHGTIASLIMKFEIPKLGVTYQKFPTHIAKLQQLEEHKHTIYSPSFDLFNIVLKPTSTLTNKKIVVPRWISQFNYLDVQNKSLNFVLQTWHDTSITTHLQIIHSTKKASCRYVETCMFNN